MRDGRAREEGGAVHSHSQLLALIRFVVVAHAVRGRQHPVRRHQCPTAEALLAESSVSQVHEPLKLLHSRGHPADNPSANALELAGDVSILSDRRDGARAAEDGGEQRGEHHTRTHEAGALAFLGVGETRRSRNLDWDSFRFNARSSLLMGAFVFADIAGFAFLAGDEAFCPLRSFV